VNLLHYGDALSMANSIESRLPFMDYRLVEFVFTLPWEFKINLDLAKYIHRETMKGIVPESILNNPIKFGFNTPISQFFKYKNNLNIKPLDILLSDQCLNRGLFDKKNLLKLVNDHNSNKQNHSTLLYRILSVELWFQTFIDSELDKNN
jgi:asparagine synthase (glutamine-hydrolysing)